MKKLMLLGLGLFVLGVAAAAASESRPILRFGTMVGNSGPFIGNRNPICGVPAGGAPWVVQGGARGALREDGQLRIQVRGLVLVSTGTNPAPNFRGRVCCLSIDDNGEAITVNDIITEDFPATMEGDSDIEATVELPDPCIAPIIFVTSSGGAWFAATGL